MKPQTINSLIIVNHRGFIFYNAVSFQLVWWSSVLWGNWSLLLTIPLLLLHFGLVTSIENPHSCRRDLLVMIKVGVLGVAIDALLTLLGVFEFNTSPWWLDCLWLHFGLSLNHSLNFLRALPVFLQAILGGVFGSLSYLGGAQFYAVSLPLGVSTSALILAVLWTILLPLFVKIALSQQLTRR
ncbi:DUF2878 domain-containing protein [Shewanella acanthi]|uniref:DUF2878 domain-containing protein n=1 Tax=Shewanella acanthi TaxID=2864212 RepID=UPI001C658A6C|nr:DUF2878 domain-containing protein [Shewanella acanthi]QYJ79782.1 DUF2878 domain-containing protein [Shewanella acanthi]